MKRLDSPVLAAFAAAIAFSLLAACGERASAPPQTAAAPASAAHVKLDVTSTYPTSLTLVGESSLKTAKRIHRASGGEIELKIHEPGALVPGLQAIQAVSRGSVDAAWSAPGFFSGIDPVFNLFTTVPFGPGIGEYLAWMYYGGGQELQNEMFAQHDVQPIICGIHPPESSGWFRKEIKTVGDLKGMKMRFFGLGGRVMEKLGVSVQLLAPGDIFQALQLGTIDATEFSMPALDQKLGFYQVAKYYYFPGWHQQASIFDLFINKKKWDSLSDRHKAIIELACGDSVRDVIAEGEAIQWKAMKEMQDKNGVKILRWSPEIMKAYEKAWNEVVAEESAKSANFKKVWDSYSRFRADYAIWREYGYLNQ